VLFRKAPGGDVFHSVPFTGVFLRASFYFFHSWLEGINNDEVGGSPFVGGQRRADRVIDTVFPTCILKYA
jgi:hypothetical protein